VDIEVDGVSLIMASPSVLSVGQCGFDHALIARNLEQQFGARVHGVETFAEALEALRRAHYDLMLVNRINDSDGAPGIDLIRSVKAEPGLADVPVMLVSGYTSAQQQAQALGALPGFGKSDIASASTRTRLQAVLGPPGPGRGPAEPGGGRQERR
jgi:two-component system chemotaxis response regulator CheY